MNRASSTPPATKAAATDPAPHPFDGASMTAQSSAVSPAIDKTAPTGSRRGRAGSLDSGTSRYPRTRSEEHTSELQSLMRISYAVFCLKKKTTITDNNYTHRHT